MAKVVTFGELMLRLAPEGYLRFTQANKFNVFFTGAEGNVLNSLTVKMLVRLGKKWIKLWLTGQLILCKIVISVIQRDV